MTDSERPNIRPVERSDRSAWLTLRHALWPDEPISEQAAEVDSFLAGRPLWILGNSPVPFAVLIADSVHQGPIGFVEVSLRPFAEGCGSSPVGYLEGLYVRPDHRRRGVGSLLIRAAESWAKSKGCQEMASDTGITNDESASTHKALGYVEVERDVHFRRKLE